MNREEIIRMAREAECSETFGADVFAFTVEELERFAALVAAAEREACAKACEETTAAWAQHLYNSGCVDCAAAIRARSKQCG